MMDFRDRFEDELVAAARRQALAPPARLRSRPGRLGMLALGVTAATATALAATQPWRPAVGDRSFDEPAPSISATVPPAEETRLLGVLRREQRPEDRGASTREALRYISSATTEGVRTAYIRTLGNGAATLVPVRSNSTDRSIADALCVFYPDPGASGGANSCWSIDDVRSGRATGSLGTHVYGLVPDGVATVEIVYEDGSALSGPVSENFYDIDAKAGPGTVRWLDDRGLPVAPAANP